MVPSIEEKPPPVPGKTRFQVDLENPRLTNGHAVVNGTDMLVTTPCLPADTGSALVRTVDGGKVNGVKGVVKNPLSTESSASSLSSGVGDVAPTHHVEKLKPKLMNGGTKHTTLKRSVLRFTIFTLFFRFFSL